MRQALTPADLHFDREPANRGRRWSDGFNVDEKPWTHPHVGRFVARTGAGASFVLDAPTGSLAVEIQLEGPKTYFPVPFFLSSAGYAIHLATTYRTETHFGSEPGHADAWRAAVSDTKLTTVVYVHEDPLASLDDFTRDTGRPMVPATSSACA